jgi:hypothetical protein
MPGAVTPICSECGVSLCFDVSLEEYDQLKEFWDQWRCEGCDPAAPGSRQRFVDGD